MRRGRLAAKKTATENGDRKATITVRKLAASGTTVWPVGLPNVRPAPCVASNKIVRK